MKRPIIIAVSVVVLAAAMFFANRYYQESLGPEVQVETIERRSLAAVVSASGKIQPKRLVNISADTMGRVTELAVDEGALVERGQFLMLIDPEAAESAVEMGEAGIRAGREALNASRVAIKTARANLELSLRNEDRLRKLHDEELVSRETLDRTESEVKVRRSELEARETEVRAQVQRLAQETANLRSARHVLSKVTIDAPMEGMITRLNIEEGETVVVGTMNNAGTVLMTIADLSVLQAELEVDETDIVDVRLGQSAVITIDAIPSQEFHGQVTKIGSSAKQNQNAMSAATGQSGTNFEVEVTVTDEVPGVRPDFSCTADITTAVREDAVAVPIQALTVREIDYDSKGARVHRDADENSDRGSPRPGHRRKEVEGVFVYRDGQVVFTPVTIGIAGERHFEILTGLDEGDEIITGPYSAVREIVDGDRVKLEQPDSGSFWQR
jgi:HlyD family secretion protein